MTNPTAPFQNGPRFLLRLVRSSFVPALALATVLSITRGSDLGAQQSQSSGRPLVTIALTDNMPEPGGPATVIRRVSKSPEILILLNERTVTAPDLAAAMGALARSLSDRPDGTGFEEQRIRITQSAFLADDPSQAASIERLLERVRRAPTQEINGYGSLRAISIPAPVRRKDS